MIYLYPIFHYYHILKNKRKQLSKDPKSSKKRLNKYINNDDLLNLFIYKNKLTPIKKDSQFHTLGMVLPPI